MYMKMALFILIGMLLAVGAMADEAQIPLTADQIIAARQAAFALMGGDFQSMKVAVQQQAEIKPYGDVAKAMNLWSRSIPDMFPAGTDKGHDTQAKPEVWSDPEGFRKAAQNFSAAAALLSKAAESGDKAAFADQFKATGKTCGECHRVYRVKQPG